MGVDLESSGLGTEQNRNKDSRTGGPLPKKIIIWVVYLYYNAVAYPEIEIKWGGGGKHRRPRRTGGVSKGVSLGNKTDSSFFKLYYEWFTFIIIQGRTQKLWETGAESPLPVQDKGGGRKQINFVCRRPLQVVVFSSLFRPPNEGEGERRLNQCSIHLWCILPVWFTRIFEIFVVHYFLYVVNACRPIVGVWEWWTMLIGQGRPIIRSHLHEIMCYWNPCPV